MYLLSLDFGERLRSRSDRPVLLAAIFVRFSVFINGKLFRGEVSVSYFDFYFAVVVLGISKNLGLAL